MLKCRTFVFVVLCPLDYLSFTSHMSRGVAAGILVSLNCNFLTVFVAPETRFHVLSN